MKDIREPQVAGMFYPANANQLKKQINEFLDDITIDDDIHRVAGIVAPHAGYIYSGKTAAYGYKTVENANYKNVVVISPSHREYFKGVSIYPGDAYSTPLGKIKINKSLRQTLTDSSNIIFEGIEGHRAEHALEVQLPFLQVVLKEFELVPMVIGDQAKDNIYELADRLADAIDDETLLVASSDLSHFYTKNYAHELDQRIADRINEYRFEELQNDLEIKRCEACGGGGIVALMKALKLRNIPFTKVVAQSDSGDITGDESEVVGYLSAVVYK